MCIAIDHCLRLLMHLVRRDASRADCTAGSKRATRTPMMAMTTRSSTRVKPGRWRGGMDGFLAGGKVLSILLVRGSECQLKRSRTGGGEKEHENDYDYEED